MDINTEYRRGIHTVLSLSVVVFLVAALVLAPAPGTAATSQRTDVRIHKLQQPDLLGQPADGLPMDIRGMTPVSGAEFTAKRVPEITPGRDTVDSAAEPITLVDAGRLVAAEPVAMSAVTDANGDASIENLIPGLYFIQETRVPDGYVAAAPFLVQLPFPDPSDPGNMLDEVHVYPKNSSVAITLQVNDEDAIAIRDLISWHSQSDIGVREKINAYRVEQNISPGLELVGEPSVRTTGLMRARVAGSTNLEEGTHYVVRNNEQARTMTVEFLDAGLRRLEAVVSLDPSAQVHVDYETKVLGEGVHTNTAVLYPDERTTAGVRDLRDSADSRWGPLSVVVHEKGSESNQIPGAKFQLFGSAEDALLRRDPIRVAGVDEWTTDEKGRIVIRGLRFSDRVNDLDRESSDRLHRVYWAAPIYLPEHWNWVDASPQGGTIESVSNYQTLVFEVHSGDSSLSPGDPGTPGLFDGSPAGTNTSGGPDTNPDSELDQGGRNENRQRVPGGPLASTGAQVLGFVSFGVVLMIAGILLIWRRRHPAESEK